MTKRVLVTGYAALTAAGKTIDETWQSVKAGNTGIAPIKNWDADHWEYPLAAEIKEYKPRELIRDRKLLKLLSRQDVIGLNVVDQLLQQSGIVEYRDQLNESDVTTFNDQTGIYVGSPGNKFQQQYDFMPLFSEAKGDMKMFAEHLFEQVHPMWLLRILPNNVLAYAGIQNGFKGANQNIANHGVSGLQAIHEAQLAIQEGLIERALVVAYDSVAEPQGVSYYGHLGVMSARGLKPFDLERDGTILGEGAGAILLESEHSAKQRGAPIHGEILAGSSCSEAKGIFPVSEDGVGVSRVIKNSLAKTKYQPADVGMVTAHGNATMSSDASEANAFRRVFGDDCPPVTAFKWCIGHTVAAAGVIETILSLLSLKEKQAPGVHSLQTKGPKCLDVNVLSGAQTLNKQLVCVLGRGFGGLTSSVVLADANS